MIKRKMIISGMIFNLLFSGTNWANAVDITIRGVLPSPPQFALGDLQSALSEKGIVFHIDYGKQKKEPELIKVLFSGNLTRRKGVDLLPLIAEKLDANIEILYTTGLRTKKKLTTHPNLKNIGAVPYSYMPKVYQDADILLFPTVREGFGLAAAEAMACGLPVVASNCSAIPELIDNGKGGFLCPVGDVDAFAEKLNILSDSARLRQEMGEYNRAKVEKMFTVERMVNEYKDLFEEVLG